MSKIDSPYSAASVPILFKDPPDAPMLNYDRFHREDVNAQIDKDGFAIVRGLVPAPRIERIRTFWIEYFAKTPSRGRVTWAPYFGQENHVGFSNDKFQYLSRACDFLWNDPLHAETRDVCLRMHALRNLLLNEDPYYGMKFTDGKYGIFITTSHYPPGSGHMEMHNDGVTDNKRLFHSLVPLTFKGKDYKEGGMVVVTRGGKEIDVDALLEPGDAVFYDGALKHGVKPIVGIPGQPFGRIQMFPIPTVFSILEKNIFALSRVPMGRLAGAKWLWLKNQVRITLGMSPAMR